MTKTLITRDDYMSNKATHDEYYNQFVTEGIKNIVLSRFTKDQLTKAYRQDKNFNTLALRYWDELANAFLSHGTRERLKECGDSYSLGGGVCILKQAAKHIVNEQ